MAKVVAEFDTKTKSLSVTVDGASVANASEVGFYRSYEDEENYHCSISTVVKDKNNGTVTYHRMLASNKQDEDAVYLKDAPEFSITSEIKNELEVDIEKYFNEKA